MDFLSQATNVSNWTLSLILGFTAALQSGAENGIVGELPFCDILLVADVYSAKNGCSGDNVVIGFESRWSKMMVRSFESKRLEFCYLLAKKAQSTKSPCDCHMVLDPMWKRWKEDSDKDRDRPTDEATRPPESGEATPLLESGVTSETNKPSEPDSIKPNMFYGLVEDFPPIVEEEQGKQSEPSMVNERYKIIHSPECIKGMDVDVRASEFISEGFLGYLKEKKNGQALEICWKIIKAMGKAVKDCNRPDCNKWDKRIIDRLEMVMEFPKLGKATEEGVPIDEVIDRVHSRIPDMLRRLDLKTFEIEGCSIQFTIEDVTRATIIYFGIKRALEFSRRIYEEDALVIMGYNIDVGHEIVADMTEIPTTLTSGFSSKTVLESTNAKRFQSIQVKPNSIFILAITIDTLLAAGIMILSGLGPILSMFTSRRMTAPYRESYLRMGTTMRWSLHNVTMMHTGTARDDWMVCLQPEKYVSRYMSAFLCLATVSSLLSIILWILPFGHEKIMNPARLPEEEPLFNIFAKMVCVFSLTVGVPWVFMAQFVQNDSDMSVKHHLWSAATVHTLINVSLVVLLSGLVFSGIEVPWIYLYVLEFVYFAQWLVGELANNWCYESTSLLMIGVLGAVRLCNMPES